MHPNVDAQINIMMILPVSTAFRAPKPVTCAISLKDALNAPTIEFLILTPILIAFAIMLLLLM